MKWWDGVLAGYNCQRSKNIYFRIVRYILNCIERRKNMIETTDHVIKAVVQL